MFINETWPVVMQILLEDKRRHLEYRPTLPRSTSLVIMTMIALCSCHIIRQKSTMVLGRVP